jgi:hypothetical protein
MFCFITTRCTAKKHKNFVLNNLELFTVVKMMRFGFESWYVCLTEGQRPRPVSPRGLIGSVWWNGARFPAEVQFENFSSGHSRTSWRGQRSGSDQRGCVQAVRARKAPGVHDIEAALFDTSRHRSAKLNSKRRFAARRDLRWRTVADTRKPLRSGNGTLPASCFDLRCIQFCRKVKA